MTTVTSRGTWDVEPGAAPEPLSPTHTSQMPHRRQSSQVPLCACLHGMALRVGQGTAEPCSMGRDAPDLPFRQPRTSELRLSPCLRSSMLVRRPLEDTTDALALPAA